MVNLKLGIQPGKLLAWGKENLRIQLLVVTVNMITSSHWLKYHHYL